jgi:hypothetical protein
MNMYQIDEDMRAKLGLELATIRQEHADLDAAIHALDVAGTADQMTTQRLKKKKLVLKDRIVELEKILLPDIIA